MAGEAVGAELRSGVGARRTRNGEELLSREPPASGGSACGRGGGIPAPKLRFGLFMLP